MNELILEELRYDLEGRVRQLMKISKNRCYQENKQKMENSRKYMQCIKDNQLKLQQMERKAKDQLLFMELSNQRNPNFELTSSTVKFIDQFGLMSEGREKVQSD